MTPKQKELAAMYGNPNKITKGDIITAAKKNKSGKKEYNNGQRKSAMYGGSIRKPMMYGGLAQQNRTMTTGMASKDNPMGTMTEKKRYDMGMSLGGAIKKFRDK